MGAVSQLVPNFLGGVSTRPDTQKAAGEVREATNVYLDPTFGLTKRSGFKFIKKLGNASSFTDAHWFSFKVDTDEFYIGAIVNQAIYLWNSDGSDHCWPEAALFIQTADRAKNFSKTCFLKPGGSENVFK